MERFKESYNAKLANGIGNLTNRVMKMAETYLVGEGDKPILNLQIRDKHSDYFSTIDNFDLQKTSQIIESSVSDLDKIIQSEQPFKLVKTDPEKGKKIIKELVERLYLIAEMLAPIIPSTSEKIKAAVQVNKMPEEALFLRRD
jgi:methionyl-tRNA synthetase